MNDAKSQEHPSIRVASSKIRYATRALVYLAAHGEGRNVAAREIASAEEIPEKYLEVIVGELRAAGILESVKGKYGGFHLARSASRIRLTELYKALEGPPRDDRDGATAVWTDIERRVTEVIDGYTVADALLLEERRRGVVNYTI